MREVKQAPASGGWFDVMDDCEVRGGRKKHLSGVHSSGKLRRVDPNHDEYVEEYFENKP